MQIKFARRTGEMREDCTDEPCSACGFHAAGDMHAYREAKENTKILCSICFNAMHVLDIHPQLFRLIWLPEIKQTDIAHISRVSALLRQRIGKPAAAGKTKTTSSARDLYSESHLRAFRNNAVKIMEEFNLRGKFADDKFLKYFGMTLHDFLRIEGIEKFPLLISGLRLLPIAFTAKQIEAWANDSSSLNGYGFNILKEQEWFVPKNGSLQIPDKKDEMNEVFISELMKLDSEDEETSS